MMVNYLPSILIEELFICCCVFCSFSLKGKGRGDGEDGTEEITVYDYFVKVRKIELRYSADLPCINVGKPKRPTFFPIEVN